MATKKIEPVNAAKWMMSRMRVTISEEGYEVKEFSGSLPAQMVNAVKDWVWKTEGGFVEDGRRAAIYSIRLVEGGYYRKSFYLINGVKTKARLVVEFPTDADREEMIAAGEFDAALWAETVAAVIEDAKERA